MSVLVAVAVARLAFSILHLHHHRSIADFTAFGAVTLKERLTHRANANKRLEETLGINNSFTTTDPQIHRDFRKLAESTIRSIETHGWVELSELAASVLSITAVQSKRPGQALDLAPVVRIYTFKVILHVLFGVDTQNIGFQDAKVATETINRLWLRSKTCSGAADEDTHRDQVFLQAVLRRMLPACYPCESQANPLNLIMPAYETMWRVVLLTFVTVAVRDVGSETRDQFQKVLEIVPQCFGSYPSDDEKLALAFAKEGMRPYPPTKRVYRASSIGPSLQGSYDTLAADVERCHHEPTIWGTDAHQFRPSRFYRADGFDRGSNWAMRQAYFPFGVGRHICPAANGFGFRMVILLVVALGKRFGTKETGLSISFEDDMLQEDGKALLPTGRGDMEEWKVNSKN
ncbi:cytochrome P450 [Xylariomycetidae sp. FL2044]|nr:cytochrome P450 [Xylariomycetidae sp. FL2044]KAH9894719.1 cytochrome P450 [Xylariomycetidae sp. FL2044]